MAPPSRLRRAPLLASAALALAAALGAARGARAGVVTAGAPESAGLAAAEADAPLRWYATARGGAAIGLDPHGVFAAAEPSVTAGGFGGVVGVGFSVEREGCREEAPCRDAFALAFGPSGGAPRWRWRSGAAGVDDGAAAVAVLAGGAAVVAGWRRAWWSGRYEPYLTKLSALGEELWSGAVPLDGEHGAFEALAVDPTDGGLLVGGFMASSAADEFTFKSAGNTPDGTAVVLKFAAASLAGAAAPARADAVWERSWPKHVSVKALRAVPAAASGGAGAVALLWKEEEPSASLVRLGGEGETLWREAFAEQHEGTDVAVAADGSGFAISGHGGPPGVQGRVTVVAADGASSTTATVTLGGDPDLIFTECWGIAAAPAGGFVLACGAGIEECGSGLSASQLSDCRAGRGDPRAGATPRAAGVWRSLVTKVDATDGALVYQRVDSWTDSSDPDFEASEWSSAAEFVVPAADGGGYFVLTDESDGVGLIRLGGPKKKNPNKFKKLCKKKKSKKACKKTKRGGKKVCKVKKGKCVPK